MNLKISIPVKEFGRGNACDIMTVLSNYKSDRTYEDINRAENVSVDEYRWYSVIDKHVFATLLRDDSIMFKSYAVTSVFNNDNFIIIELDVEYGG